MEHRDEKKLIEHLEKENIDFDKATDLSGKDKEMLKSIQAMNDIVQKDQIRSTSAGFSDRLMASLMSKPIRTSGKRLMLLLLGILGFLLVICTFVVLSVPSTGGSSSEPVNLLVNQINTTMSILGDPRLQQFLLVAEGIILLVILEKVLSSQRFFGKSV